MAEDRTDLMLEILKRLQGDMAFLREEVRGAHGEIVAIKHHIAAFMAQQVHQDSEIATLKLRLDRIERRLELAE